MKRVPVFIFSLLISFSLFGEEGVISHFNEDKITFHTPQKTYEIKISDVSDQERKEIEEHLREIEPLQKGRIPYRQRKRFTLNISDRFKVVTENKDGLRPDCNEIPISPEEIFDLANNSPKDGMVNFLQSLPEGSLQVMTMMKETQSRQHHKVGPKNPRILRSNADGSLTISFVCDPDSQDYGKVEMMYFDRKEDRFKMATLDFSNVPDKKVEPFNKYRFSHLINTSESYKNQSRINHNPKSCLKCHSNDPEALNPDPRALWNEYNEWPGAYGSKDDRLDPFSDKKDREELIALKKHMKDNPCFQTLPLLETPPPVKGEFGQLEYSKEWVYPYSEWPGSDYDTRPNLRFTDNLARFSARRLVRKFMDAPGFERVRYEAAMSTFNCPEIKDYNKVFKGVSSHYQAPEYLELDYRGEREIQGEHGNFTPIIERGDFRDYRELFQLGKAYGFKNSDWTLFFNDEKRSGYQAPSSTDTRSDGFGDLVQGELLRRLVKESPSLKGIVKGVRDIEELFGEKNACIEEETTPVQTHEEENAVQVASLCKELDRLRKEVVHPLDPVKNHDENLKFQASLEECLEDKYGKTNKGFEEEFVRSFSRIALDQNKYDIGRSVAGTCFNCHSKNNEVLPDSLSFFESEEETKNQLRKGPEFMATVRAYINSGRMPKGIPLDSEQREAFLYYMENLYIDALTKP